MAKKEQAKESNLTYGQIVDLNKCFDEVKQSRVGVSHIPFKTSVVLGSVAISKHLKVLDAFSEKSKEYNDYISELRDVYLKYADKNAGGDPIYKTDPYPKFGAILVGGDGGYYSYSDESYLEMSKDVAGIKEKYGDAIKRDKEQADAYAELLKETIEDQVSFKSLKITELPSDLPIHIIEKFVECGLVTV